MSVYFTSDLHLGHKLASEKRKFSDIESHDNAVIESLKKTCNKKSVLFILGDIAMDEHKIIRLDEVPGRKRIVLGNHDYAHYNYRNVCEHVYGIVKYKQYWLSHCPIHPQEMYRCVANIHGHIHKNSNSSELGPPYINVNWDYWHRPVSLDEIRSLCDEFHR